MCVKTILVVDDEIKIIRLTRDYLENAGFAVLSAGNGEDALAIARVEKPDLIILCWCGIRFEEIDPEKAAAREGWEKIPAVDNKRIHPVEEGWYGRPGPRVVLGVKQLAEWIAAI